MINKKSIWFLTLFSLILVLSVYYITMPSELLLNTNANYESEATTTSKEESTYLVSLKVAKEEELLKEMENLQLVLNNNSSIEEKNEAYTKMKNLNKNKAEEEKLEKDIKDNFNLECMVKIKGDNIEVVINNKENNTDIANKIMRKIQSNYQDEKYITVKFIS